jgi:hypothetical protein
VNKDEIKETFKDVVEKPSSPPKKVEQQQTEKKPEDDKMDEADTKAEKDRKKSSDSPALKYLVDYSLDEKKRTPEATLDQFRHQSFLVDDRDQLLDSIVQSQDGQPKE